MLTKMLTSYAGNTGSCGPGECIDLEKKEADRFIDRGMAVKPTKLEVEAHREKAQKREAQDKADQESHDRRIALREKSLAKQIKAGDKADLGGVARRDQAEAAASKAAKAAKAKAEQQP